MLFTNQEIEAYKNKYCESLPGAALDLVVETIIDFLNTAIELSSDFPREMTHCITTLRNNCKANMNGSQENYAIILYFLELPKLAQNNAQEIRLDDFCTQHYRIAQIGKQDFSDLNMERILDERPEHRANAQIILLDLLNETLAKLRILNKNASLTAKLKQPTTISIAATHFHSISKQPLLHNKSRCHMGG